MFVVRLPRIPNAVVNPVRAGRVVRVLRLCCVAGVGVRRFVLFMLFGFAMVAAVL